ncbi:MAG: DMT family transporter [Candidatus Heimdallarchaeota archaeon]|nr:DMT family transporter [Candidatus Heimdallarchaeota archaeon]
MTIPRYIYTLPIISSTWWGVSVVGGKVLNNNDLTAIDIVFGRFAIASLVFIPLLYFLSLNRNDIIPTRNSILPLIGLSLTGVSINNIIFYTGLGKTDASVASLLVSINPLATMLSAVILLNEKMTKTKYLSVVLGILGVGIVIGFSGDTGNFEGNILILIAVVIWGISFSFSKIASNHGLSSIAITGWSVILGTITLLPFVLNKSTYQRFADSSNNMEVKIWFLFLGVISSVFAYIIHYKAIEVLGPGTVAPSTNLISVSGVIFAFIILKESIKGYPILGFLIIIIGVYLVQKQSKSVNTLQE